MDALHFDSTKSDDERREALYRGDIFVYGPRRPVQALADFAAELIAEAFAPHNPTKAHEALSRAECAEVLADLKPSFIHHPESKRLVADVLTDLGCDPDAVYFDVPRMRSSYPLGHLTTGIAYAFPNHRDTWYSAPQMQLNWWLPVLGATENNGLSINPMYFKQPVANNSAAYNYYRWNATSRGAAVHQIDRETRTLPSAHEPQEPGSDMRIVCPQGESSSSRRRSCMARCRIPRAAPATASTSAPCTSGTPKPGGARPTLTPRAPATPCATTCVSPITPACPNG